MEWVGSSKSEFWMGNKTYKVTSSIINNSLWHKVLFTTKECLTRRTTSEDYFWNAWWAVCTMIVGNWNVYDDWTLNHCCCRCWNGDYIYIVQHCTSCIVCCLLIVAHDIFSSFSVLQSEVKTYPSKVYWLATPKLNHLPFLNQSCYTLHFTSAPSLFNMWLESQCSLNRPFRWLWLDWLPPSRVSRE